MKNEETIKTKSILFDQQLSVEEFKILYEGVFETYPLLHETLEFLNKQINQSKRGTHLKNENVTELPFEEHITDGVDG